MDELAQRLREDAARIDAEVSPQLEQRIAASLHAVRPVEDRQPAPRAFGFPMWLASSLTGIAATVIVIVALNVDTTPQQAPEIATAAPPVAPALDLDVAPAMLTGPLEQEFENLRSDLEKAEQAVREDIGLSF